LIPTDAYPIGIPSMSANWSSGIMAEPISAPAFGPDPPFAERSHERPQDRVVGKECEGAVADLAKREPFRLRKFRIARPLQALLCNWGRGGPGAEPGVGRPLTAAGQILCARAQLDHG
jgi:hypothetical protein